MENKYQSQRWYRYLEHTMQDLVKVSLELVEQERKEGGGRFHDYSFVVFPMAKAYEGFVKKMMLDMGLIGREAYESHHFRVGKSLNPDLPEKYRDEEWVFGELEAVVQRRGKKDLAKRLWGAWKEGRNKLFHYWPAHENFVGLEEAEVRVREIIEVMRQVLEAGLV